MTSLHSLFNTSLIAAAVVAFAGCSSPMSRTSAGSTSTPPPPMSTTPTATATAQPAAASSSMTAATTTFSVRLTAAAEVPPVASNASGSLEATFDKASSMLRWKLSHTGLSGPATAGHFHGPAMPGANAGVVVPWQGAASPSEGQATLTAAQAADLLAGKWYANVHTAANPGGEIRGQLVAR